MRIFTNGRGLHPLLTVGSVLARAQWCLDGTSAAAGAEDTVDNISPLSNVSASNPTVITDSDIGFAARRFSGTAQYLYGASTCPVDMPNLQASSWIFSFRIPLTFSVTGRMFTYAKPDDSHASIRITINSTKKLTFSWTDTAGATTTVNSAITLPQGKWIHLVVTRGSSLKLYLWGALAETLTFSSDVDDVDSTQRFVLGADGALGNACAVDVSSVTVYQTEMSATDVEDQLRRMLLLGFDTYKPARVKISDGAGTLLDVSTDLPGGNWLKSASRGDEADADVQKATFKLFRNIGKYSLARYSDNPANRLPQQSATAPGVDSTTYYGPGAFGGLSTELLAINRLVTMDTCRLPLGVDPNATDYKNVFRGVIDHVAWGDPSEAVVNCLDEGVFLRRAFIMTDQEYGSDTGSVSVQSCITSILADAIDTAKVPKWGLGEINSGDGLFHKASSTITVKYGWTNGMAWPAADPGWNLKKWTQNREAVLSALKTLAEQDALIIRYMFNPALEGDARGGWYLTLFEPPRLRKWIDVVLTSHELLKLDRAEIGIENIRTSVSVVFLSSETTTPTVPTIATGTTTAAVGSISSWSAQTNDAALKGMLTEGYLPCRYTVTSNNLSSTETGHYAEDEFGLLPCETVEPAAQNINSIAEAQRLGVSILRDLCYPKAELGGQFEGMPEIECYDSIRLRADTTTGNGTADMDTSIVSLATESPGGTSLELRGTPSGGTGRHMDKITSPGGGLAPSVDVRASAIGLPVRMRAGSVYAAAVAGPYGLSNLKQSVRNGDFSGHTFGDPYPPDAWEMHAGTWDTEASLERTIVESGTAALRIPVPSGANGTIKSLPCPMNSSTPGVQVEARCWVDGAGAITNEKVRVSIEWLDSAGATLATTAVLAATPPVKAAWKTYRAVVAPNASARFYRVHITRPVGDTGDDIIYDRIQSTPMKASFVVLAASAQTGLSDKTATKVTLGTETYDWGGNFASSTFTVPEDGWYEFSGHVDATAGTVLNMVQCALYKNGSVWLSGSPGIGGYGWGGGAKDGVCMIASGIAWMTRGDTVDLYVMISGTGSLDVTAATLNGRLVSVE